MTVREKIDVGIYDPKTHWTLATRGLYRNEYEELVELFRTDLEQENNVVGHPMAEKLFNIAWERGHSSGLREVELEYAELSQLLSKLKEESR